MSMRIKDATDAQAVQTLPLVMDSTSKEQGNQDGYSNCGDRIFELVTPFEFLQINQQTRELTLTTESNDLVGSYGVTIQASLVDLPDKVSQANFNVVIEPCQV
jgi:hypothetical protein